MELKTLALILLCLVSTCDVTCAEFPGVNFTNILLAALTLVDPKSIRNTVKSSVTSYTFGICELKSCTKNVDEIEPRLACYSN